MSPDEETITPREQARPRNKVTSLLQKILPWVITAGVFYYIFSKVPISQVLKAMRAADLRILLPVVIPVYLIYYFADALTYYLAINWYAAKVRFIDVMVAKGATFILNMVNFLVGQGGMAVWIVKKTRVSAGVAISTVVFVLFVELLITVFLCALGVLFFLPEISYHHFFSGGEAGHLVRSILITFGVVLLLIAIWSIKPQRPKFFSIFFRGPFMVFDKFKFRHISLVFGLKMVNYICDLIGCSIALEAFNVNVSPFFIMTFLPIVYLLGSIPVTVLGLGTTQLAWWHFFKGFAPKHTIVAFSLVWSFIYILGRAITGVICLPKAMEVLKKDEEERMKDRDQGSVVMDQGAEDRGQGKE